MSSNSDESSLPFDQYCEALENEIKQQHMVDLDGLNYDYLNNFYPQTREALKGGIGWLLGVSTGTLLWVLGNNKNIEIKYIVIPLIISVISFATVQSILYYNQYYLAKAAETYIYNYYIIRQEYNKLASAVKLGQWGWKRKNISEMKDSLKRFEGHSQEIDARLLRLDDMDQKIKDALKKFYKNVFNKKLGFLFFIGLFTYLIGLILVVIFVVLSSGKFNTPAI
jgi:hypothetical protein